MKNENKYGLLKQPVQEFRIAIFMSTNNDLYRTISDAFIKELKRESPHYIIEIFIAGGTSEALLDRYIDVIFDAQQSFGLLHTIGQTATDAAWRKSQSVKKHMPLVFSAIHDPIGSGFIHSFKESRKKFTGIALRSSPEIVPAQLIAYDPKVSKKILVPYRKEIAKGQLIYDMHVMIDHFQDAGKELVMHPYTGNTLPQSLFTKIRSFADVIIPEGGCNAADRSAIEEFCSRSAITVHKNGKRSIENGSIFAMPSDASYIGLQAAHIAINITSRNTKAYQNPCEKVVSTLALYKPASGRSLGVSFSPYYLHATEKHLKSAIPLPQHMLSEKSFLAFCQNNSLGLREALTGITSKIKSNVTLLKSERSVRKTFYITFLMPEYTEGYKTHI